MIKELFLDLETTGVAPDAGVWQIGGIIRYEKVLESFEFECDIFDDDSVDPEALKMAGKTLKDLSKLPDPGDIYKDLIFLLDSHVDRYNPQDKFFFIGYGAEFDAKHLRRWFEGFGDKFFGARFFHPWICVMTLAANSMREIRHRMPNFQLRTVLDFAEIKYDEKELHSARYDAEKTMELYDHIMTKIELGRPKDPVQKVGDQYQYMDKGKDGKRHYKLNSDETISRRRW